MSLRERINSDPKLQAGIAVVLLLAVAFVFLSKGGGEEEAAGEEPTAAITETGVAGEGVEEVALAPVAETGGEGSLAGLSASIPAPAMPPKVKAAYESGKIVTILFVHDGGIDDRLVKKYWRVIHSKFPAEVRNVIASFTVPAKKIAAYGAISLGLGIQRLPAFVVIRPRQLSGGKPSASVLYGYQTPETLGQEIADSVYHGPQAAYYPK